ncbi:MAG: DUF2089 domain-containing protein [Actinomycetia bacterium]|jgi:hypothetical protein|nr:DUF2089 domain-containing protein [Actinomycetes bacterium]
MSGQPRDPHADLHRPPRDCPVCSAPLALTRLGCRSCGTELSGAFRQCAYCGLSDADLELLRVFLVSRGNMKDLERHLGVSYPTARQRFADLLRRIGLEDPAEPAPADRDRVLADLAAGRLSVDEAESLLRP